jgi:hypothetical protein
MLDDSIVKAVWQVIGDPATVVVRLCEPAA